MPLPSDHRDPAARLSASESEALAETMRAFASPSRLRILTSLLTDALTVEQLADAAGLSASATSHQLRLLRAARVVRAAREGRHIRYALNDRHVADLLAAVRHHHEHLHPEAAERPGATLAARGPA